MVAGRGIDDMGKLAVVPGELARFDQHACNRVAVAADEFRRGVHNNVGAMLKWTTEIGRGEGVVHN